MKLRKFTTRTSSYLTSKDPRTPSIWVFTSLRSTCRRGADSSIGLTSFDLHNRKFENLKSIWTDTAFIVQVKRCAFVVCNIVPGI
jgi:hypothetical protein